MKNWLLNSYKDKELNKLIRKGGLGKGLGALIPENDYNLDEKSNNVSLNLIRANENQPRKSFDDEKIIQLGESIKEHGIIQPLILKKDKDMYIIIAGERRWRAAKYIGLKEVPAIIMDLTDKDVLEVSLIENIQREDLNPIEEAFAYQKLITDYNLTQEQLGKKLGKSRTAITNCLRLLNLDKRVQDYLIDTVISEGHGRALLSIEDKEIQYNIAQTIIDENLSVRETEVLIRNFHKDEDKDKEKILEKKENVYVIDIKNKLENLFGTRVFVKDKNGKGKIEIGYYSNEELQRILEILNIN